MSEAFRKSARTSSQILLRAIGRPWRRLRWTWVHAVARRALARSDLHSGGYLIPGKKIIIGDNFLENSGLKHDKILLDSQHEISSTAVTGLGYLPLAGYV